MTFNEAVNIEDGDYGLIDEAWDDMFTDDDDNEDLWLWGFWA